LLAARIRGQIVRGELKEGDRLPSEIELMERFGVSRPTLREAFRILEAEDLISVKRGSRGGARVTQPSLSVAARYVGLLLQLQGATTARGGSGAATWNPPRRTCSRTTCGTSR
jgi:GntR family transcriptional regulator, transcriptional repressor for pyruvate dehydrogenase complex